MEPIRTYKEVIDGQEVEVKVYDTYGRAPEQITRPCQKINKIDEYEQESMFIETWGV